jgi:hypothetical protein
LNSGQVGGLRAALFISRRYADSPRGEEAFLAAAGGQIETLLEWTERLTSSLSDDENFIRSTRAEIQERMSSFAAHIRDPEKIEIARKDAWALYDRMKLDMKIPAPDKLSLAFKNLDLCLTHAVYLEALAEYIRKGGKSRGSYLVLDKNGEKPCEKLGEEWRFSLSEEKDFVEGKVLEVGMEENQKILIQWADVRPIPKEEIWFEKVWNAFLRDEIIRE